MVNIKINNVKYFFNVEQAKYILENYKIDTLIAAKKNIKVNGFSDPLLKNKTIIEINYNLLRRVFEKLEIDLNIYESEQFRIQEEEKIKEKEEKKYQQRIDDNIKRKQLAEEERSKLLESELSKAEVEHVKQIQQKLESEQKLNKIRKDACLRIKIAQEQVTRMFETFNGIVMDGNIKDADNLEKAISFKRKKEENEMIIQDYYNVDHKVSLDDAQKMVDEIQEHFYEMRDKKQELYNQVADATSEEVINKIRFKI